MSGRRARPLGCCGPNVFQAEGVHAVKDGVGAKGGFASSAPEVKIHVEVAGGQDPVVWIVFIAAEHWRVDEYRQIGDLCDALRHPGKTSQSHPLALARTSARTLIRR